MAILFGGNKVSDMTQNAGCEDQVVTGIHDPLYVMNSIRATTDDGFFAAAHKLSAQPEVWFHFRTVRGSGQGPYGTTAAVEIKDDNNKVIFRLTRVSAIVDTYNTWIYGAATLQNPTVISLSAKSQFDIGIQITATHIVATIYVNKVFHSTFTTTKGTSVGAKRIEIYPRRWIYASGATNGISEVIIATTLTVDLRLANLKVASQGFHAGMEGDVMNLNDPLSALGLISDLAGERQSWLPTAYGGPADGVAAIIGNVIANRVGGNPSHLAQFLRIGGADYDGSDQEVEQNTIFQQIWERKPSNNLPWTTADLALIELGVKSET